MSEIVAITGQSLRRAAVIIHGGGLVVLPTDTVYGVACDPFDADAISRIYAAKRRPRYKALQVILASVDDIDDLGLDLPVPLNRLAATFLPGAFSPIAVARDGCTLKTLRPEADGSYSQALRVPNSAVALRILRATGPVAASSANRSGGESPQTAQEAYEQLGDDIDLYLDGGVTQGHIASTVVSADQHDTDGICVEREGVIPAAVIRKSLLINGGSLGA